MKENIFIDEYYYNPSLHTVYRNIHLYIISHGYSKLKRGWNAPAFHATFSHLYFILDGELTVRDANGTCFTLSQGNCYLIPAGYPVAQECASYAETIHFHIKLCGLDGNDLLKNCPHLLTLPLKPEQSLSILDLIHSQDVISFLNLKMEIYTLLLLFLTKYHIALSLPEYPLPIQRVIQYINTHLSMTLSVNEICTNVCLAPSTLSRDFKAATGTTIGNYIDHAIMSRAQQMLMSSEKSILDVSESLGFCDQGYFTRKFKSTFGISPSAYKKLQQNTKK